MKNQTQAGGTLTLVAPSNLTAGQGFLVGVIFAIASQNALSGEQVEGKRMGVYTLPKTSAQAWSVGDRIYWDATNNRCDNVGTVGLLIGAATAAATNPSTVGSVVLSGTFAGLFEGAQTAIADISTANASDLPTAQALANSCKSTINTLLAELRTIGVIL
ncbi:DUF2190 family protein [Undibacterium sp. Ji22W]|uniref:DUF2190 family protein n=1 Tax=Undibacterium sp. Ji22W TaxID=3413038 RepID=UPI003BF047B3